MRLIGFDTAYDVSFLNVLVTWVNLLYEVINEAIVLPLYFFMGQALTDKEEYSNRLRSGIFVSLVMILFGFYVLYAFQNIFDATFYGRGKTTYMLFESVVTNSIYSGIFFILYLCGVWKPTLIGIALMFGCGNAFDTVVSFVAYRHFLKKENIRIFSDAN